MDFYAKVLPQVEGKDYQILVEGTVKGRTCTGWKLMDVHPISLVSISDDAPSRISHETITWLHLSDLHFRIGSQYDSRIVLNALLRDVADMMHGKGLSPNFIAITGDISFSGNPDEYQQAKEFLDDLLESTGLTKERLFVVPGNHDVDRSVISTSTLSAAAASTLQDRKMVNHFLGNPSDRKLVFQRLRNYADFVNDYFGPVLSFDDDHYYYVKHLTIGSQKIAILGLNSAWLCGSDMDQNKILIGERQVRTALDQSAEASIRVALVHHPFDWLKEFDRNDSEQLLTSSCDFVLHGHLHQTGVHQLSSPDSSATIIAAGASYENRDYPNAYNFVQLSPQSGKVILRRYSDTSPGFWSSDTLTYKNAENGTFTFRLK